VTKSRLRVIDLTDELAHQGVRMLVGIGADVIRVAADERAPGEQPQARAEELHWHAGKRTVTVPSAEIDDVLLSLLPGADVVVESGAAGELRTIELRRARPELWAPVVHVVVTPFGLSGPRAGWRGDDLVVAAAGGMAWLGGDPGDAPEPPPRKQAVQLAGAHAAIGALLGLLARDRTRQGQLVEISAQEAVAATLETGAISWIHGRSVPGRTSGVYGHVAHRVFAGLDGHLGGGYSGSPRMWDDLLAWMVEEGEAEDLTDPQWQDPDLRWRGRSHVDEVVAAFVSRRRVGPFAEEARRRALPWAEVSSPAQLTDNPQLRHRDFLIDVESAEGRLQDVGFAYPSPALPRPVTLAAPEPVGPEATWLPRPQEEPEPRVRTRRKPVRRRGGALDGVRVLDLTWVLAGPYVTKTLGEHGAEIVKVESFHRKDPTRFAPGMRLRPEAGHDDSGYFLNFNRNKESVAINLRTERGQELLRRLVPEVDVVVENFSPGVLSKWGLGFEQLRELNPEIILVSMAGVGQDGPWRNAVTFADTLAAMSGLTYETGRGRSAPQGLTFGLGDMVAANAAVLGTLELLHAGRGGHVDLAQLEAMASSLGPALLEAQLPASSDADVPAVLPGVFRTRGDDRWLAIGSASVESLAQALTRATGLDVTPHEAVTALARTAAREDADDLAAALQEAGIAAYPVRDGRDLVDADPQLAARGFYTSLDHPIAGPVLHEGLVAHLDRNPGGLWEPAPLLGQHTDAVLGRLLDLSAAELADLHHEGILE
jgi:crotonobetainyl-CoA:carnitine CoA-transferase CaiB-like acyl-CoA transferase